MGTDTSYSGPIESILDPDSIVKGLASSPVGSIKHNGLRGVGGCLKIEVMRISLLPPSMEVAGGLGGGGH